MLRRKTTKRNGKETVVNSRRAHTFLPRHAVGKVSVTMMASLKSRGASSRYNLSSPSFFNYVTHTLCLRMQQGKKTMDNLFPGQ